MRCHPNEATIQRLITEQGLPKKVEEQLRSPSGVCLTAKVDKMGLGNKKVDFSLSVSHDAYLKKFKGTYTYTRYEVKSNGSTTILF